MGMQHYFANAGCVVNRNTKATGRPRSHSVWCLGFKAVFACCPQFAPSYSDYVLYSDGGPADNVKRKKFRGQKGTGGASLLLRS